MVVIYLLHYIFRKVVIQSKDDSAAIGEACPHDVAALDGKWEVATSVPVTSPASPTSDKISFNVQSDIKLGCIKGKSHFGKI